MTPPADQLTVLSRRAFVLGTAALGAAAGAPAFGVRAAPDLRVLALFDGEIEDGRRFAALAASAGQTVQDTARDLAPLLYGELRDWARDPSTVLAGVTRYADFNVAAGIAREQGRSVIAALAREKAGGASLIVGSPASLAALADRLPLDGASLDRLVRQPGSVVWICA